MKQQSSANTNKITIKDLCHEDKKKIGKLIKRLAQEREEKEQLLRQLESYQSSGTKQKTIQNEIDKLDYEINILQQQQLKSQHQSPNFKVLDNLEDKQQQQVEQSSSFILPITQRDSPIKVDQIMQTSMVQKKGKSSHKKQILIQKLQEFEKIVNRLNFSNDQSMEIVSRRSVDSSNTSYLQSVYQKLVNLESQLQHLPPTERNSENDNDRNLINEYNEDDIVIQLLNQDNRSYQPSQNNSRIKENIKPKDDKVIQEAYCRNVLSKYNNLLSELNK